MGRDRSAHWEQRRRMQAQPPRTFVPREYLFDARVRIAGETGPACIEPIRKPLVTCPQATLRVIVRWAGKLPRGARVDTGDAELIVLRMFPMSDRVRVAHLLCVKAESFVPAGTEDDLP